MNCLHVLGLIDAGPFADYPRAHLDAAWAHARQCDTCGPALDAAMSLATDLTALPQMVAPPDLTATVMARIARIEEESVRPDAIAHESRSLAPVRDWSPWATALGGLAAGVAIVLSTPLGNLVSFEIASPGIRGIAGHLATIPPTTTGTLALAAGVLLYAAGLFGPLNGRNRP